MSKVYCKNCKFNGGSSWTWCEAPENEYTSAKSSRRKEDENRDGECERYRPSFWYKLKRSLNLV